MEHSKGWCLCFHPGQGQWIAVKHGVLRKICALTRERLLGKIEEYEATGHILSEETKRE